MNEDTELAALPREELVERARALQTVLRVAQAVTEAGSVGDLAERFVDAVVTYTRFPSLTVLRYLPAEDGFEIIAQRGFDESKFPPRALLPAKGSLTGLAAERGEIMTTEDLSTDARVHPATGDALTKNAYVSGTCVPVIHGGEVLGSFNLIYPRGTAIGPGELSMLGALGKSLGVAMAQRIAVEHELELDRQARRAQQLESLGVLAGGIAHDFNNLLMGIIGNVEMARIRSERAAQSEVAELLSAALSAAARATALAKQLLTFSRGGAPSLKPTGDLGRMLGDIATFAARGTSVRCEVEIEEPLGVVAIDADQIAQVIQNLVLNACQASSSGGTVTLRARRLTTSEGARVVVEVADRGTGIAPENLPHIFEPFFSARPGGTGLGLAVSHSIVNRHGGRLSVESTLGTGTTLTVELPGGSASMQPASPPRSEVAHFSGRALVMDDEESVRLVARAMLMQIGFEVDVTAHGAEALEFALRAVADERPYRVGLLDLTVVGGLGGADIADHLRRACPGIRLVVSSGYADAGHEGWDGRLQKPYSLFELSDTLARVVGVDAADAGGLCGDESASTLAEIRRRSPT